MSKPDFGEPWVTSGSWIRTRDGETIAGEAKRDRVVACVNACAGLTDEELLAVPNLKKMAEACELVVTGTEAGNLPDGISYQAAKAALRCEGREP